MSRAKLEKAKGLIQAKQYAKARAILKTLPRDATAQKWLARLDEIAPEQPPRRRRWTLRLAALSAFGCIGLYILTGGPQDSAERNATRTAVAIAQQIDQATADANATVIALSATATFTPSITPTATHTPLPSNTAPATASPTITDTPLPGATVQQTPFPRLTTALAAVAGVQSVNLVDVLGDLVVAEILVQPGLNTEQMANAIAQAARAEMVSASLEISVILDDGRSASDYVWSNRTDSWTITALTLPAEAQQAAFTPQGGEMMAMSPETYTTTNGVNVRSCPQTTCDVVVQLAGGTGVTVIGAINGESVNSGNTIWHVIERDGQRAYVYSGFTRRGSPPPTAAPIQVMSTVAAPAPMVQQSQPQVQWNCGGDLYNCGDFDTRADLMSYWNACPGDPSKLDQGGQPGVPCESN